MIASYLFALLPIKQNTCVTSTNQHNTCIQTFDLPFLQINHLTSNPGTNTAYFVTGGTKVMSVRLDSGHAKAVFRAPNYEITGMTVDSIGGFLYYSQSGFQGSTIRRVDINTTDQVESLM